MFPTIPPLFPCFQDNLNWGKGCFDGTRGVPIDIVDPNASDPDALGSGWVVSTVVLVCVGLWFG